MKVEPDDEVESENPSDADAAVDTTIESHEDYVPVDWWDDLLPTIPYVKPPGDPIMLRLIVYDIADPKRLRRIAKICEDYGIRIQGSVFECWLDDAGFADLWSKLGDVLEDEADKLAAYKLDKKAARQRIAAGVNMAFTQLQGEGYYL